MLKNLLLLALPFALLTACGTTGQNKSDANTTAMTSPDESMKGDWESLFNGKDLSGWHKYGGDPVGSAWKVKDNTLYLDVADKDGWQTNNGGDIVTDKSYGNYELELEWKISECGNSGIIYNVQEGGGYSHAWKTGPEMQVLDNTCHPDAKIKTHRAGDLYDFVSVKEENVKPAGEWNMAKLVVTDGMVQHWLNGMMQVEYKNTGDKWKEMISDSKFRDMPNWGMFTEGKISLQDHGDGVWFRNIRIRELSK